MDSASVEMGFTRMVETAVHASIIATLVQEEETTSASHASPIYFIRMESVFRFVGLIDTLILRICNAIVITKQFNKLF